VTVRKASVLSTALAVVFLASMVAGGAGTTAAVTPYDDEVLADTPRGYWRLGETTGTIAADASPNGNTGSYRSGVTLGAAGALGGDTDTAARFDGVEDRVTMADPASGIFDFGTGDFTVEAWIKTSVHGDRTVLGKKSSGPYWFVVVTDDSGQTGRMRATIYDGAVTRKGYGTVRVDDGAWHHVAVVFQRASGIAFYVDGAAAGFAAGAATGSIANSAPLQVGKTSGGGYFSGDVDEAAVYNVALSAARIQAHYDTGYADTISPAVTLTSPANGEETLDTTPTFGGTAGTAPGDSSTVTVNVYAGATATGTPVQTLPTTASGGTYAVDALSPLAVGQYTAQAEQADADGNLGLSAPTTFTVSLTDTTPPQPTLTAPANGGSTADPTPTFAGVAGTAAGDSTQVTVKLYIGPSAMGSPIQTLDATAGVGGAYAVEASAALALGEYTARTEQVDGAGNTGFSAPDTFTVSSPILLAAGDIAACGETTQDEPTAQILDSIPDGIVALLGDNVYSAGSPSEYTNCYEPTWGRHKARTRPSPGNHDYTTAGAAGYYGYFGAAVGDPSQGWYSYDVGDWHVIALNSNCYYVGGCDAGSAQEQWLRADLAAHPTSCTLAYWHHPRFNSSGTDSNNLSVEPLWQALWDHGAELVLNGHAHLYERYAPQAPNGAPDPAYGIRQITSGTGGYVLYPWGQIQPNSEVRFNDAHGVLKLTLEPNGYNWQFLPVPGKTSTDSGSSSCHGVPQGPPPPPPDSSPPAISLAAPSQGSTTGDSTPTFAGTAGTATGDSTTVVVKVYNGTAPSGTPVQTLVTTRSGGGAYAVEATSPLALGTYTAQAEQGDASGNTGFSSANTFMVVDPGPPPPPPPPPSGTGPAVRSVSSATANGPASELTLGKPAGTSEGDLLIAVIAHQGGSAKNMPAPAGWTEIPGTNVYQGTNARIHAWYRFAGPTEPDFWLFTLTGGGDDMAGGIMSIVRGRTPVPIDAAAGQANATSTRPVTAPSITTTVADTLLLFAGACNNPATFTPPAGMTEQWDRATSGAFTVALETAVESLGGAQATGTRVATASGSCRSVAIDVAVAPAAP
jgi:hypothetical protein